MLRQKIISSQFLSISLRLKRLPILAMLGVVLAGVASPVIIVRADSFQDQINALNAQKAVTQGQLDALQLQASSYQDAIDKLQAQINGLQAAINANTAKQHALEAQIAAAE